LCRCFLAPSGLATPIVSSAMLRSARARVFAIYALATLLIVLLLPAGCAKRERSDEAEQKWSAESPPPPTRSEKLAGSARIVLAHLVEFESKADVTCWTSFRQLDWFIAEHPQSEFATLAKIRAQKGLLRAAWSQASQTSKGEVITGAAFDA